MQDDLRPPKAVTHGWGDMSWLRRRRRPLDVAARGSWLGHRPPQSSRGCAPWGARQRPRRFEPSGRGRCHLGRICCSSQATRSLICRIWPSMSLRSWSICRSSSCRSAATRGSTGEFIAAAYEAGDARAKRPCCEVRYRRLKARRSSRTDVRLRLTVEKCPTTAPRSAARSSPNWSGSPGATPPATSTCWSKRLQPGRTTWRRGHRRTIRPGWKCRGCSGIGSPDVTEPFGGGRLPHNSA